MDTASTRIAKIEQIISECPLGIHDISRTELDKKSGLPRFNMPFELGLFLGAKRFGGPPHNRKRCIVLDRDQYRYQQFLSDISGQDIAAHDDDAERLVGKIRDFLNAVPNSAPLPGVPTILADEEAFRDILPAICNRAQLDQPNLAYADFVWVIADFLSD